MKSYKKYLKSINEALTQFQREVFMRELEGKVPTEFKQFLLKYIAQQQKSGRSIKEILSDQDLESRIPEQYRQTFSGLKTTLLAPDVFSNIPAPFSSTAESKPKLTPRERLMSAKSSTPLPISKGKPSGRITDIRSYLKGLQAKRESTPAGVPVKQAGGAIVVGGTGKGQAAFAPAPTMPGKKTAVFKPGMRSPAEIRAEQKNRKELQTILEQLTPEQFNLIEQNYMSTGLGAIARGMATGGTTAANISRNLASGARSLVQKTAQQAGKVGKFLGTLKPEEVVTMLQVLSQSMQKGATGSQMATTTESKKIILARAIAKNINEQKMAYRTANLLLTEGPFDNVFSRIKQAGSAALEKIRGATPKGAVGQMVAKTAASEDQKNVVSQLTSALAKAGQARQKFNQSILKNSESMSQYHDVIYNLYKMFDQNKQLLGAFEPQMKRQVESAVGNLYVDLESEKSQIATFLKSLEDVQPGTQFAKGAAQSAQQERQSGLEQYGSQYARFKRGGTEAATIQKGREEAQKQAALAAQQELEYSLMTPKERERKQRQAALAAQQELEYSRMTPEERQREEKIEKSRAAAQKLFAKTLTGTPEERKAAAQIYASQVPEKKIEQTKIKSLENKFKDLQKMSEQNPEDFRKLALQITNLRNKLSAGLSPKQQQENESFKKLNDLKNKADKARLLSKLPVELKQYETTLKALKKAPREESLKNLHQGLMDTESFYMKQIPAKERKEMPAFNQLQKMKADVSKLIGKVKIGVSIAEAFWGKKMKSKKSSKNSSKKMAKKAVKKSNKY